MTIAKSSHSAVLCLLASISTLLHSALADSFINPSNDNTDLSIHYTLGTTVPVTWDCSLDTISLIIAHWGGNDIGALLSDVQNSGSYTWKIGELDNINDEQISESPNFVLIIRDPTDTANTSSIGGFVNGQMQSRGFVIDSNDISRTSSSSASSSLSSSSTSTSPSSSSSSSSSTSTSSSSASTSPSSSISSAPSTLTLPAATTTSTSHPAAVTSSVVPTPTPTPVSSHGLGTGVKAGIAVGAALGGLLLLGLGTFLGITWTRRSKRQQAQFQDNAGSGSSDVSDKQKYYKDGYGFQPVPELPSGPYSQRPGPVHELGGSQTWGRNEQRFM